MTLFYPHYKIQWIRLREKLQENPMLNGKIGKFPVKIFP